MTIYNDSYYITTLIPKYSMCVNLTDHHSLTVVKNTA